MSRTQAIRIKAEIVIPYTREFGAASEAERVTTLIKDAIGTAMNGTRAVSTKWSAEHTTVEAAEEAPAVKAAPGTAAPRHAAE